MAMAKSVFILCILIIVVHFAFASVDPAKCEVTGSGLGPSIEASKTYRVNLQAKDSSSINISSGGSIFRIVVSNKCIKSVSFSCDTDSTSKTVLANPIHGTMIDNGDGTYYYEYSLSSSGTVTVSIYLLANSGIYYELFPNQYWSGTPTIKNYCSDINFNWGSGSVAGGPSDYVTIKFFMSIKAPTTETYTFEMIHDDGSYLFFDGVNKINGQSARCVCDDAFTMSLTQNQIYDIEIDHLAILLK